MQTAGVYIHVNALRIESDPRSYELKQLQELLFKSCKETPEKNSEASTDFTSTKNYVVRIGRSNSLVRENCHDEVKISLRFPVLIVQARIEASPSINGLDDRTLSWNSI